MLTLLGRVRGLGCWFIAKTIIDLTLYLVSGILVFIRNKTRKRRKPQESRNIIRSLFSNQVSPLYIIAIYIDVQME